MIRKAYDELRRKFIELLNKSVRACWMDGKRHRTERSRREENQEIRRGIEGKALCFADNLIDKLFGGPYYEYPLGHE